MAESKEEAETPEPLTIRGDDAYASLYRICATSGPYLTEATCSFATREAQAA